MPPEDYERANAREWDLHQSSSSSQKAASERTVVDRKKSQKPNQSSPPKQQIPHRQRIPQKQQSPRKQQVPQKQQDNSGPRDRQRRPLPPPRLIEDAQGSDNEAQQQWRQREPEKDRIRIPEELVFQDRTSDTVLQDRVHESIARENGCFIASQDRAGSGSMTFGIWGEKSAVVATKQALLAWIKENDSSSKSHRSAAFSKIHSLTPVLQKRAQNAWKRDVKRQRYRQHPPPGTTFGAIGSFHWPVQEYRPGEIFGVSYEALDPIRMDCECYISFYIEKSLFRVYGKVSDVQEALQRLRKTLFQIAARQIPPAREYLLHCRSFTNMPSHVYLRPYSYPVPISGSTSTETHGNSPCGEWSVEVKSDVQNSRIASEERLQKLVMHTIKKLHYYRGTVQFRFRLGTLLATQFKKPNNGSYELHEYEDMTKQPQFIGHVTQELGDKNVEQAVLSAIQHSDDLLVPDDHESTHLTDVQPIYSATFTFEAEAGDIRLTMSWINAHNPDTTPNKFERISKKWIRLDRNTGAPNPLLGASLMDISSRGIAWQTEILASQNMDESRLSQKLRDFGDSIKLDPEVALDPNSEKLLVIYKPYAVPLKHIQQRVNHHYLIRGTDYTLELSRFQDRSQTAEPILFEPRWSVSVFRKDWDTTFARNENLKIGEMADWEDDVDSWFPKTSTELGFEGLMGKLEKIKAVVMG